MKYSGRKRAYWRRVGVLLAGVVVGLWLLPAPVQAGVYGHDLYGSCNYKGCTATTPSPTVVTTPSGLKIAVNLTEGQEIPREGYVIKVTPINGQGATFAEARIYINGALAQTAKPDETGTASWRWDPLIIPGTKVTVEVTDADGSIVTESFTVRIAREVTASGSNNQGGASETGGGTASGPAAAITRAYHGLQNAVRALPKPVADTLPYILFVLLGINAVLLLLQLQREVREYHTLQALLARLQLLSEQKKTFVGLISHYLRTPLTVLAGGIDLLSDDPAASQKQPALQAMADRMRTKIEQLISKTQEAEQTQTAMVGEAPAGVHFWRRPGLIVPTVLIGGIALGFDMLAIQGSRFSHNEVQIISQVIVFAIVVLTTYQVFRRVALRKRDRARLEQIVQQENATAAARDEFISGALQALRSDLLGIEALIPGLGQSPGGKFISDGAGRFRKLLAKFIVADRLRGSHSAKPPVAVQLHELMQRAQATVAPQATAHKVALTDQTPGDITFATPEPDLLVLVLQSILDNAVAYSPEGGAIDIRAEVVHDEVHIAVRDHGPGIPQEKLALIFQPFYRAEGAENFTHEGMGFSLYMDKTILTYLGGDIQVESRPQEGTQVEISVPVGLAMAS